MILARPTTAKAFAKNVFINQERKSEVRRRSDTVVVLTINDASLEVAVVVFHDPATARRETISVWVPGEVWLQS